MPSIQVHKLATPITATTPLQNISSILHADHLHSSEQSIAIAHCPWESYTYKPSVSLKLAYNQSCLYLEYSVREKSVRAVNTEPNSSVYEDSCVEFFFTPENSDLYYNFEFNCIGTCLAQKGKSRADRAFLEPELLKKIRRESSMGTVQFSEKKGDFTWTLTIELDMALFVPGLISLMGKSMRGNFYKCGDKLESPHYLSWNPVASPKPDFHRPEFFGELIFR